MKAFRPGDMVRIVVHGMWDPGGHAITRGVDGATCVIVALFPTVLWPERPTNVSWRLETGDIAVLLGPFGVGLARTDWYRAL